MNIYKIINLLNNKIYIGKEIVSRDAYYGSGIIIKRALKKYGIGNFRKEIIYECDSLEELNDKEIHYIKLYNSTDNSIGYNISNGGDGGPLFEGHTHTKNSKDMMSKAQKLRIKKNGHNMVGFKHSNLSKEKMSVSHIGKQVGINNGMYGKHHSGESKKLMSRPQFGKDNGMYGKHHTDKVRLKISQKTTGANNPFFGKKHTEETKKRISNSMKGRIPSNIKPIIIDGILYYSAADATCKLGIKKATIAYRVKSNSKQYENYKYAN